MKPAVADQSVVTALRERLKAGREALFSGYPQRHSPRRLLAGHARCVDAVLRDLWRASPPAQGAALVATGGYGRGELFPHSDVDILVLLRDEPGADEQERIAHFIGLLWDLGLEAGHGVRTVSSCLEMAATDITVQTTLLEARYLCGARGLVRGLLTALHDALSPADFFTAKRLEQEQRHARHQDTAYALEPNLKEAPGGLRDLHTIQWIAHALGLGAGWTQLEAGGLIEHDEAIQLRRHERMLQDLRIRLHLLAARREDRIIFDLQSALAREAGLSDTPARRASELLMQRYYRTAKAVTQLNVILLQNFEARLSTGEPAVAYPLNERFLVRGDHLDAIDASLFERDPRTILESFLLLQQHPELRGMTAATLRALWRARRRVDARFRRDPAARLLFLQCLQQSQGIVHETRRMNQYGILGRYLPEFGRIVGQMQHDLFHVYTVDQHILMVVRNLRRFTMPELAHEFPLCSELISGMPRAWLLYVAALFHDIAKGRGGDHSVLGAKDVRRFCSRHGISADDSELVAFLVEHHLTMSSVAQKQDVHDPEVVAHFAELVGSERRLIALYLLTVADVRGTSPKVWNAWKAKLLEDLFKSARRVLTAGQIGVDAVLAEKQEEASRILRLYALDDSIRSRLWQQLDTTYFLRHDAGEIAWHTRHLHYRVNGTAPVAKARLAPFGEGLQVMVYCHDREALFARICGYFDTAGYSIAEAKIHTTRHGYALDTFVVLGQPGETHYRDMINLVESGLCEALSSERELAPPRTGRLSRRVRHFPIAPAIDIRPDERGTSHVLSIVASDRPGLLYGIARTLAEYQITLRSAKVNTLGDRAEDTFLVSGNALQSGKTILQIEQRLLRDLRI